MAANGLEQYEYRPLAYLHTPFVESKVGQGDNEMDEQTMDMMIKRPYGLLVEKLRASGLRPTRQRLALAKLLFENGNRHVTAEQLHTEALQNKVRVSLATVYNTLHQFTDSGLMREIVVDAARSYFDTNTSDHHHFFFEKSGALTDIHGDEITVDKLPRIPNGAKVTRVEVIVRLDA